MKRKRQNRTLFAVLALVLALSLALAACSGGAEDRDSGSLSTGDASSEAAGQSAGAAEEKAMAAADGANVVATSSESGEAPQAPAAAGGADANTSGTAAAPDPDQAGFDRKIVYRANLTMEVADFDKASIDLQNILHQSGGYILKFSDSKNDAETGATYTLKVPASGFMPFLDRLEGIEHKLFERQMQGTDVTEEYVDLEARLKASQVVEARLLSFMDKAKTANELLQFSNQLATVQGEIERIKGRMRYLDTNVAFSTIELRMYQRVAGSPLSASGPADPLGVRMAEALKASTKAVGDVLQGVLVFAAGAIPVLLLIAVIALPFLWLARRSMRTRPVKSATAYSSTPSPLERAAEEDRSDDK